MLGNFQPPHNKFLPGAGSSQKPGGAHRIGLRARKVFVFIRAAPRVSEPRPGRALRTTSLQKSTFRASGNEPPGEPALGQPGPPPAVGGNEPPREQNPQPGPPPAAGGNEPPGNNPPQPGQGHRPGWISRPGRPPASTNFIPKTSQPNFPILFYPLAQAGNYAHNAVS